MSSHLFKPLQQRFIDPFRTELDDELFIVDCGLFAILGHGALHVPRCDYLLVGCNLWLNGGANFGSVLVPVCGCRVGLAYVARVAAASVEVTASTTVDGVGSWDMFLAESVQPHQPQPIFKIIFITDQNG